MNRINSNADASQDHTPGVIYVRNLTRFYRKNRGIEDVSFHVNAGEIFGFIGPNGAGKTTTINILLSLLRPCGGEVRLFGKDIKKSGVSLRRDIGYIPGELELYENITGDEYLKFFAQLRGKKCDKKIQQLSELFFNVDLKRKIKTYSRGMKQILGIIQAFMSQPLLYILDEPTTALDPLMNQRFYDLLREEKNKGKTVFLSSHMLGEVERVCDRVLIIKNGKTLLLDSIENIRKRMEKVVEISLKEAVPLSLLTVEGVSKVEILQEGKKAQESKNPGPRDTIYRMEVNGEINPLLRRLGELPLTGFDYRKMTLEELFWKYFQKENEK